jgi:hypothetical protein
VCLSGILWHRARYPRLAQQRVSQPQPICSIQHRLHLRLVRLCLRRCNALSCGVTALGHAVTANTQRIGGVSIGGVDGRLVQHRCFVSITVWRRLVVSAAAGHACRAAGPTAPGAALVLLVAVQS